MPLSLRIPSEKEEIIRKAAAKQGKSKTTFILEAVDEKLGLHKSREQIIRELAGWMTAEEAEDFRRATKIFDKVQKGDWD